MNKTKIKCSFYTAEALMAQHPPHTALLQNLSTLKFIHFISTVHWSTTLLYFILYFILFLYFNFLCILYEHC